MARARGDEEDCHGQLGGRLPLQTVDSHRRGDGGQLTPPSFAVRPRPARPYFDLHGHREASGHGKVTGERLGIECFELLPKTRVCAVATKRRSSDRSGSRMRHQSAQTGCGQGPNRRPVCSAFLVISRSCRQSTSRSSSTPRVTATVSIWRAWGGGRGQRCCLQGLQARTKSGSMTSPRGFGDVPPIGRDQIAEMQIPDRLLDAFDGGQLASTGRMHGILDLGFDCSTNR